MKQVVKVAKIGKDTNSTNPNDYIFHSDYNTFKIIKEGTYSGSHDGSPATQEFSVAHDLQFVPMVSAFLLVDGESVVYPPNGLGVTNAVGDTLVDNGVSFDYVEADNVNVYFSVTTSSAKDFSIRYFLLEEI